MARNARVYLRYARSWFEPAREGDQHELIAALVHMLLLPKLECHPDVAIEPLEQLCKQLEEFLEDDHDVIVELQALRDLASAANHGVLRGLR